MASTRNLVDLLNRAMPIAKLVGLGTLLQEIVTALNAHTTAINALISDHNTLRAKLNADDGVTDTNYAASTATAQTALTDINDRD